MSGGRFVIGQYAKEARGPLFIVSYLQERLEQSVLKIDLRTVLTRRRYTSISSRKVQFSIPSMFSMKLGKSAGSTRNYCSSQSNGSNTSVSEHVHVNR